MAPSTNHPFMEGLEDVPEGKKKDLQKIKSWMETQPHLPPISDEYIYLFLHACYYSQEKTKSAIENYFSIRSNYPAIFGDRDFKTPRISIIFNELGYKFFHGMTMRNVSHFCIHPEKLKQMMKAKDGQILCNFFASEEYKNRISAMAEEQKRVLNEDTGIGLREDEIKYEHVLNCAQPLSVHRNNSKKHDAKEEEEIITLLEKKKRTKPIKTTAFSVMLKKKKKEREELTDDRQENRSTIMPLVMKTKKKNIELKKKFRKRTTIMPIFLKRMEQRSPDQNTVDTVLNDYYKRMDRAEAQRRRVEAEKQNDSPGENVMNTGGRSHLKGDRIISSRNLATLMKRGSSSRNTKNERTSMENGQNSKQDLCDKQSDLDTGEYLLKLPKTTPEGYRILIYSVKDNDPTKMNFSDCVKAFCMFNDVILSEDGLQEGYVVIFDMKGVQLGHLARVSLPALRCFMLYIQEAHPCRLKAIHVLNTASWIHHVMRLIVPLVKSELLNLVQFHRGDTPENLPIELLPVEYGGEAPGVEKLHEETIGLIQKYQEWMVESVKFSSDESKRAKKASWWGLFGSSKSNAELDEKTILKNLQID